MAFILQSARSYDNTIVSRWKFFLGAAILAVGVLGPFAPMPDVLGGIALAAVLHWKLALGDNKSETPRGR